jgi:hypothetical protein
LCWQDRSEDVTYTPCVSISSCQDSKERERVVGSDGFRHDARHATGILNDLINIRSGRPRSLAITGDGFDLVISVDDNGDDDISSEFESLPRVVVYALVVHPLGRDLGVDELGFGVGQPYHQPEPDP